MRWCVEGSGDGGGSGGEGDAVMRVTHIFCSGAGGFYGLAVPKNALDPLIASQVEFKWGYGLVAYRFVGSNCPHAHYILYGAAACSHCKRTGALPSICDIGDGIYSQRDFSAIWAPR